MQNLHIISILLEIVVVAIGLMLAILKKKSYGWGIVFTFAIYVLYDLSNFLSLGVPRNILYLLFFIATLSILWVVARVYKES